MVLRLIKVLRLILKKSWLIKVLMLIGVNHDKSFATCGLIFLKLGAAVFPTSGCHLFMFCIKIFKTKEKIQNMCSFLCCKK